MPDPDWRIEPGGHGPRIVMTGRWSAAALEAAVAHGVRELELNYAKGWKDKSLGFLGDLRGLRLKALELTHWTIDDVSPVHEVGAELRRLKVFTYCKSELRFSEFPKLDSCSLEWRAKAKSLFECSGLEDLFINRYPSSDLGRLARMTGLRKLSLKGPKIVSCDGAEPLRGLESLGLHAAKRLESIEGVALLTNLTRLEITHCPKVMDVSALSSLPRLQELHLSSNGEIETLESLRNAQCLEVVTFAESTNILDGDLSPLAALPKLRRVAFAERRHYSHRPRDLMG